MFIIFQGWGKMFQKSWMACRKALQTVISQITRKVRLKRIKKEELLMALQQNISNSRLYLEDSKIMYEGQEASGREPA